MIFLHLRSASFTSVTRGTFAALLTCLLVCACGQSSQSFHMWTYPQSIPPHEAGWKYLGQTTILDQHGIPPTQPIAKKGFIAIIDKRKRELLRDEIQVFGGTFETKVEWPEENSLHVRIFGVVPPTTRPVFERQYRFDGAVFRRADGQPGSQQDATR